MQIMPATSANCASPIVSAPILTTPRDNIIAGAACLRELHDSCGAPGFLTATQAWRVEKIAWQQSRPGQ